MPYTFNKRHENYYEPSISDYFKELYRTLKFRINNFLYSNDDLKQEDMRYEFAGPQLAECNPAIISNSDVKEINKVYELLVFCEKFISEELKTRADYSSDGELQPYSIELTNLRDLIRYISKGVNLSQFIDEQRQEIKEEFNKIFSPITISTNNAKLNNDEVVVALKNQASDDLISDKKLYDTCIPKGALLRYKPSTTKYPYTKYNGIVLYVKKIDEGKYLTYKVEKNGVEWTDYKDYFEKNNIGKEYKSLRSAFESILYTKSKSLNETEETEYSTDDGKTWRPTSELKTAESICIR